MENEKGKIEINKLGFCLIHVHYIIIPCGFTNLLRVYRVGNFFLKTNKMIVMGVKHVITFPKFFTYYEQDMVKSIIFFDYYNIYHGWSKKW
jgi:hypothetical protein